MNESDMPMDTDDEDLPRADEPGTFSEPLMEDFRKIAELLEEQRRETEEFERDWREREERINRLRAANWR